MPRAGFSQGSGQWPDKPAPKKREEMTAEDKAYNLRMNVEVQRGWLCECMKAEGKLSAWERTFCRSLADQLSEGKALSERQAFMLEKVYADKT